MIYEVALPAIFDYDIYILCIDAAPTCELYNGSVCFGLGAIGNDYIYVNNSDANQRELDSRLLSLNTTLHNRMIGDMHHFCADMILTLMCHNSFPLCDHSSTTPIPRTVSDGKVSMLAYLDVFFRYAGPIVRQ